MKKTKFEEGITLIALIITIVILLIIAVVTIGAVKDSKIIDHAQNASSEYTIAKQKELIEIGYSEYLIDKNISKDAQLKVEGGQVTGSEENGWEIVFSETNSKYQLDKSGTITYIEEGEDSGEGEEIEITSERDLTVAMYYYNTMYNPGQPEIVSIKGYYDDGEDEYPRMSDKNDSLGAYIYWTYFDIEKDFFGQTILKPGDITGNIAAKITHFDGTEEEITLVTTDNKKWEYESEGSSLMGIDNTYIGFRPFAKYKSDGWKEYIDEYEESSDYHYIYIEGEVAVPFYKLEMIILGETIELEFPYNCQCSVGIDMDTGELIEPMYNDINNVNKVIVNFLDEGSNKSYTKVYTKEKIFDANSLYGVYYYSSPEVPILYSEGGFIINMHEAGLKTQVSSVTVEENGVATKYNVSDSTSVVHARPGS